MSFLRTFINAIKANTIDERTANSGVTIDGVLLKDSQVTTDQINEKTSAAGVTIDGMLVKDGKTSSNNVNWQEQVAFRNRLINGNFDIWQRGTSQSSSGYGSDDRWVNGYTNATVSHSRVDFGESETTVPFKPRFFSRTVITAGNGADTRVVKDQRIEDVRTFAGQTITLSFWAKADSNKNLTIEFEQYFGTGGSPHTFVNFGVLKVNLTSSWQKFVHTVNVPSLPTSVGSIGSNNDHYFQLSIWLSSGSNSDYRTDNLGLQTGTFDIAQVQLEAGSVATPFEIRPLAVEQMLCERYYERNDSFDTGPWWSGNTTSGTTYYITEKFKTTKRAPPASITIIDSNVDNFGTVSTAGQNIHGFRVSAAASATASGAYFRIKWAADSEL